MEKDHYELVILGGGPAGLAAGLYASRARIDHALVEKGAPGGQVLNTDWVDNYPGFPDGISGFDLMEKMTAHARRFDVNIVTREVDCVDLSDPERKVLVFSDDSSISCDSLIICSGARPNKLGIPGEAELTGKGVSYCGTCDAWFFKNKNVIVVGGGDSALEEGIFITRFANKVTIIHRRDEFRASSILQNRAKNNGKIEFILNSEVKVVNGDEKVESVEVINNLTNEIQSIKTDGFFVFIGHSPNTQMFKDQLELDDANYIKTDMLMQTNVPGVFVAGEAADPHFKQVITSAGMGAGAAIQAVRFLENEG